MDPKSLVQLLADSTEAHWRKVVLLLFANSMSRLRHLPAAIILSLAPASELRCESTVDFPVVAEKAEAHAARIAGAVFLEGDSLVLTVDHEKEAKVWEVASGKLKSAFPIGRTYYVNNISVSPDEQLLAIANKGGTVRVFDISKGKLLWEITNQSGFIDVDFHPDGWSLLVSDDSSLKVYDSHKGTVIRALHRDAVKQWHLECGFLSPSTVVTVSERGDITLWDWITGRPKELVEEGYLPSLFLKWRLAKDPAVAVIAVGGWRPGFKVDLKSGGVSKIDITPSTSFGLAWDISPRNDRIFRNVQSYELSSGKYLGRTNVTNAHEIFVSPSERYLVALSMKGWRIYSLEEAFKVKPERVNALTPSAGTQH